MIKAEIIAFHGWGFDTNCWNIWSTVLPAKLPIICFDRGYFQNPQNLTFQKETDIHIIFTHSLGLHLCEDILLNQADLIVIFSGFLSFHPQSTQFRRRSRMVLNQMRSRFEDNPRQVLEAFYQNVFYPQQSQDIPEKELDKNLLLNDLQILNEDEITMDKLKMNSKICILHGFQDGIVPRTKGRELFNKLQPGAKYFEVKDAGHALPFTHVKQCWSFIQPEINELVRSTNNR